MTTTIANKPTLPPSMQNLPTIPPHEEIVRPLSPHHTFGGTSLHEMLNSLDAFNPEPYDPNKVYSAAANQPKPTKPINPNLPSYQK